MKLMQSTAGFAAAVAMVAGSMSPAFAQHRIRHTRSVAYVNEAPPVVVRRDPYRVAAPVATGAVVGTTAGVLAANTPGVASALGASTTIGAGLGFGAVFGVGGVILYCAIAKPHQECF